ncbi:hypothetical protein [Guptibacillus hwajinpoensis]|uniref:hypothetical protein n=1 Tax=Guptibacillus hwajinpoensis TaxID=208199 RepID=UPI0024B3A4A5|nr:hypothetical protein [Pseudalkalibacillus hwajinpoensis]
MGISYEELFNKSKIYIDKALDARDKGEYEEFQLWASISLELLGKATLASIHPTLVVDPSKPLGLLVACGHSDSTQYKTITAKTIFDRLNNLINVPGFDTKTKDFCMTLANRRNAEIHSGQLPFLGIDISGWMPKYWDVCKMLLDFQNKKLVQFIGEDEANRAEEIIDDHSKTLRSIVESRVIRHKELFEKKYGYHSPQKIIFDLDEDQYIHTCPACGNDGVALGELDYEEYVGPDPEEPWIDYINRTYDVASFSCLYCDLKLNGFDEINFSGIEDCFEIKVEGTPDYEPDYGND